MKKRRQTGCFWQATHLRHAFFKLSAFSSLSSTRFQDSLDVCCDLKSAVNNIKKILSFLLKIPTGIIEQFSIVSKVISELLWFCITSLSGWFKVLEPLFQPIRSETQTNRGSCVHIFPRFVLATSNYFEF